VAADLRYRTARAIKEETLVAQLRDELISREDVCIYWGNRIREVWSGLYILAHRLPPELVGKTQGEMQETINREVRRLNESYCREHRFCPPSYRVDHDGSLIELPEVKTSGA